MPHASGSFDVELKPQPLADAEADKSLGRYSLHKQYHGELEGVANGEMLSVMGAVKGSGAYVAIERVTGKLAGRSGNFALYHHGVMQGGKQELHISVAPDSGTDELVGLTGTMQIKIVEGKHFYEF